MLEYNDGIFGLPLRLLAREVYDKCVQKVGIEKVALITGEERLFQAQRVILFVQLSQCLKIKMWSLLQ